MTDGRAKRFTNGGRKKQEKLTAGKPAVPIEVRPHNIFVDGVGYTYTAVKFFTKCCKTCDRGYQNLML